MPVVIIFSAALFVSALLLFLVQPMFAKMVLPLLGGSPSVWTTCMLFFQTGLLAGYGYAHLLTTRLSIRWQAAVHAAVVLVPLTLLPFALPSMPSEGHVAASQPALWLLLLLATTVGLPFFALSATAPLLQRWFSAVQTRRCGGSLLPLCGEQRGEPHRAPRVPQSCRTAAVTADAANHLGVRLRDWRRPPADLRGCRVARHRAEGEG